jgi:hypothetical protein
MYAQPIPLVVLNEDDFVCLQSGQVVGVTADGRVMVSGEG